MSSRSRTNAVGLAIGLAGNSRGSSLFGDLRPNPTVNRTRRFVASTWRMSARRAGYLARWATEPRMLPRPSAQGDKPVGERQH